MKLYYLLIILMLLLASCYFLTPEFTDEDLKLINWAEKGKNIVFVSDWHDTVRYLITDIVYKVHKPGAGIQPSLFYKSITQTVLYSNGTMLTIIKDYPKDSPLMYIKFEGVWEVGYPNEENRYNFGTDTIINGVAYNNVMVKNINHGYITQLIWSKYQGPLQYRTNDGKVWIRQNVLSDTSYTLVVVDNTAKPKQEQQSSGSFFEQTPAVIIGLVVLAIVVVYAVVALFVLNRR